MGKETLLVLMGLLWVGMGYGTVITRSTATTASITNFYQDFSYCSCDLTASLCDNYCCCDGFCSSSAVATWTAAYACLSTGTQVESFCNQSSITGFGSFNDLSCVYYSNKATIGNYFLYPTTTSITYITPTKFASKTPSNSIGALFSGLSAATANLGTDYSSTNPYLLTSANTFFLAPQPGPGGLCVSGALNVTEASSSSSCNVAPNAANCATINGQYSGVYCLDGLCAASSPAATIQTAAVSGTNCNNVLTGLTIAYTLSSTLSAYSLTAATITPTFSTVALGSISPVTVTRTITFPAGGTSGNPGYQLGKPITITTLNSITAAGSTTCATAGTGSTSILFGQSATFRCQAPTACTTNYYIDSLLTATTTIQQYASQSATTITVTGTQAATVCQYQSYTLQIVYSYGGWELDPQYYIVGAKIIPTRNPDLATTAAPTTKYFSVSWLYVDPKTVNTPPSNLFYQYFNNLWTPLRQKFGIN